MAGQPGPAIGPLGCKLVPAIPIRDIRLPADAGSPEHAAAGGPVMTFKRSSQMVERVGFIGMGFMGHGMAKNCVEKGHPLTVMGHRNRQPVEDLVKRGAKEVKSAEEVAKNSDIIFL